MDNGKFDAVKRGWDAMRGKVSPIYGVWNYFDVGPLMRNRGVHAGISAQKTYWDYRTIKDTITCTEEECKLQVEHILRLLEERLIVALDHVWTYQDCPCTNRKACDAHQGDALPTKKISDFTGGDFSINTTAWPDTFDEYFISPPLGTSAGGSIAGVYQAGISSPTGVQGNQSWTITPSGLVPSQPLHEEMAQGWGAVEEEHPF